jgi:hypothetical protein
VRLGAEVVHLVGLHFIEHASEHVGVGQVAVVQLQLDALVVGVLVEVVDVVGVERGSTVG